MREFEGMSYDEIGERLDMSRQMVESSLFRARRKLSEEYDELASGQRCEQIQTAIDGGRLRAVSALGLRDRRRFARHLAHCQPCRHAALMAGVDETLLKPRSIAAKIAALLPFPLWRLPWRLQGRQGGLRRRRLPPFRRYRLGRTRAVRRLGAHVRPGGGHRRGDHRRSRGGLAVHGLAASGGHGHHGAATRSTHQASSASGSSGASSSAAAGKATAHRTGRAQPAPPVRSGSRDHRPRRRGPPVPRQRRRGSAPGSGTPGGGSGSATSAPKQGTAGSSPSASGAATKVVNGVTKTVDGLGKTVTGAGKTVDGVANGVTNGVNKTVHNVTGGVGSTVNTVTTTVGKVTSGVANTVSTATGGAVDPTQAVGAVNKVVSSVGNGVANAGSTLVNGATGAATGTVQKVANGLTGTANTTPPSSSGSSGSSGSTPPAPATSGASGAVNSVTAPLKSGLQQAGGLVRQVVSRPCLSSAARLVPRGPRLPLIGACVILERSSGRGAAW